MEFLKNIGRAAKEAAAYLEAKTRRAAQLNRIRAVIRCQQKAAEKEYLALGRYYYHSLRDQENGVTEPHCAALDAIEQELDRALDQLERLYGEDPQPQGEEITLEGVEELDAPPQEACCGETAVEEPAAEEPVPQEPVEEAPQQAGDDNDSLPFEG